jgi:hypothetical protein
VLNAERQLIALPRIATIEAAEMPIVSDTAIAAASPHDQVDKDREIAPYSRVHPDDDR